MHWETNIYDSLYCDDLEPVSEICLYYKGQQANKINYPLVAVSLGLDMKITNLEEIILRTCISGVARASMKTRVIQYSANPSGDDHSRDIQFDF